MEFLFSLVKNTRALIKNTLKAIYVSNYTKIIVRYNNLSLISSISTVTVAVLCQTVNITSYS